MLCGGEYFPFPSLLLLYTAAIVAVAHSHSLIYSLNSSNFGPALEATIVLQNSFSCWLYLLALWQGRRFKAK